LSSAFEEKKMKTPNARMIPGLVLIVIGIFFLLAQYFEFGPGLFVLLLGTAFLFAYAFTRAYGLLIPGCILAGIGVGLLFERTMNSGVTISLGLGLGFIAIFVVQKIFGKASHWWPLIPGGVLVIVGIAEAVPQGQMLIEKGWPVILIVIGLAILAGTYWRPRTS
jgi:hypothetical protein